MKVQELAKILSSIKPCARCNSLGNVNLYIGTFGERDITGFECLGCDKDDSLLPWPTTQDAADAWNEEQGDSTIARRMETA